MTEFANTRTGKRNAIALNNTAVTAEMRGIVKLAAEPALPGESVKAAIGRAARQLSLNYRRAYTFWYGEHCAVLAHEADRLRTAELRLLAERRVRLTTELKQITARLNALEERAGNETVEEVGAEVGALVVMAR